MKKLNKIIYNKLLLQAQEAKTQGINKLASAIFDTIGSMPEEEEKEYTNQELYDDVYNGLWKLVGNIIKYHNLDSVQSEKIDLVVESLTDHFISEIENTLQIEDNND